jgi:hypothetical protein
MGMVEGNVFIVGGVVHLEFDKNIDEAREGSSRYNLRPIKEGFLDLDVGIDYC